MKRTLNLWNIVTGLVGAVAIVIAIATATPSWAAAAQRIDLAEFGRVVHFAEVPTHVTTSRDELRRSSDGWEAERGEDGQYSIGIEWDSPVLIDEVSIEFRHAIANREQIVVQYWEDEKDEQLNTAATATQTTQPTVTQTTTTIESKLVRGRWLTPDKEWWAGDRDVSFAFKKDDHERPRPAKAPTYRRTTRVRFLCGKQELPPVRYLRVYGPGKVATDTFDLRFDATTTLKWPVQLKVGRGFIVTNNGKTTMESMVIRESPISVEIRYFRDDRPMNSRHVRDEQVSPKGDEQLVPNNDERLLPLNCDKWSSSNCTVVTLSSLGEPIVDSAPIDTGQSEANKPEGPSKPSGRNDLAVPSKSVVPSYTFMPAEVARTGSVRLTAAGVTIERRGGKLPETRETQP